VKADDITEIWPMLTRKCTGAISSNSSQARLPLRRWRTSPNMPMPGLRAPMREALSTEITNTGSMASTTQSRS
jgi:hypothetical protein